MKQGFIVGDGTYAAIPFCNHLMIIYNGEQLEVCKTEKSARTFIADHKKQIKALSVPVKKSSTKGSTTTKNKLNSKSPQIKPNGRSTKRNTT